MQRNQSPRNVRTADSVARAVPVTIIATLSLVALLATSGCFGGSGKTKAGGEAKRSLTLTMQTPDVPDADAEYFIAQVNQRTHARVRIVEGVDYQNSDPDNEARLVRALRSGRAKMAYIPSRAWERASDVNAFRALQAPLLITDYALLRRITTGEIGRTMLGTLDRIGLVGLGLVPNELRRPLGRRPLVSATAFHGARLRVVTSPTGVLSVRALGAVPLTKFTAHEVKLALLRRTLDGVESSTKSIGDNGYVHVAPYLPANLALFAKTQTIAIRRDVFDRLSAGDQAALRAAAAATSAHANPAAQEREEVRVFCGQGLRLVEASASDLEALRRRTAPAYAKLERDPSTRKALRAIGRLKREVPASSASLPPCQSKTAQPGPAATPFPQGQFASRVTPADFRRGDARVDPSFPVPFVATIGGRHWHTNERPPFAGRYVVRGDQVTFIIERPPENKGTRERLKWSYFRGELTFKVVDVADSGSRVIYTAHPWRRIGR
jgi:TRAP-type C4-dicarboxylate transport system substrate-binding protein